jgi:hypothetical protein
MRGKEEDGGSRSRGRWKSYGWSNESRSSRPPAGSAPCPSARRHGRVGSYVSAAGEAGTWGRGGQYESSRRDGPTAAALRVRWVRVLSFRAATTF